MPSIICVAVTFAIIFLVILFFISNLLRDFLIIFDDLLLIRRFLVVSYSIDFLKYHVSFTKHFDMIFSIIHIYFWNHWVRFVGIVFVVCEWQFIFDNYFEGFSFLIVLIFVSCLIHEAFHLFFEVISRVHDFLV